MKKKVLLFIPTYNCAEQIQRLIKQLSPENLEQISKVIFVDNRSQDNTVKAIKQCLRKSPINLKCELHLNDANYGLGGSHKVAYLYAAKNNFDYLIVLHGDDQANLEDILMFIDDAVKNDLDAVLGSRFLDRSRLKGYAGIRIIGNLFFNFLFSLALSKKITDLGSGLNMFKVKSLMQCNFMQLPDDLTFNYSLTVSMVFANFRCKYVPIGWSETDQISNVKALRQVKQICKILFRAIAHRKTFLLFDPSVHSKPYKSKIL